MKLQHFAFIGSLAACNVKPPSFDDRPFACTSDSVCGPGWVCRDGICVDGSVRSGFAGVATRVERAACLQPTPEAACDELLAAFPVGEPTTEAKTVRAVQSSLSTFPPSARAACLERFGEPLRATLASAKAP